MTKKHSENIEDVLNTLVTEVTTYAERIKKEEATKQTSAKSERDRVERSLDKIKIALIGKFGSGKNKFLEIAQEQFPNLEIREAKFATPIYELSYMIQNHLKIDNHKDGKLLQFLGSHFKDTVDKNIWVDALFLDPNLQKHNHIITDCRFPEEVEKCVELGYKIIKIERSFEFRVNNQGNRDPNHISETALDRVPSSTYDYIVNNNGPLEMLEGAVIRIVNEINKKRKTVASF